MGTLWILEYLSECKLWVYKKVFYSRRRRFLSLPVSKRQLSTRESPNLFFFLKMVIKRQDVTSYCELQACCLVLPQFPCCLETIMELKHLLMCDTLLNPQLLKEFERNKYRRNKHPLCSLTPSQSVTSGVWNHSFKGRGETLNPKEEHGAVQVGSLHAFDTFSCLKHITLLTSGALTKRGWW